MTKPRCSHCGATDTELVDCEGIGDGYSPQRVVIPAHRLCQPCLRKLCDKLTEKVIPYLRIGYGAVARDKHISILKSFLHLDKIDNNSEVEQEHPVKDEVKQPSGGYRKILIRGISPSGLFLTTADRFCPWRLENNGIVQGYFVDISLVNNPHQTVIHCLPHTNSEARDRISSSIAVGNNEYMRLERLHREIYSAIGSLDEVPDGCSDDLKPYFTCPVCKKFDPHSADSLLENWSLSAKYPIKLGQYYCSYKHYAICHGLDTPSIPEGGPSNFYLGD